MTSTATLESIIETVIDFVVKEIGGTSSKMGPDTDLTLQGADSVKVLRVVAMIERTYDIELEDEDVFGFKTIRDVANSVLSTLKEKEEVW
jgi:acyl carrier protein